MEEGDRQIERARDRQRERESRNCSVANACFVFQNTKKLDQSGQNFKLYVCIFWPCLY